MEQFVQKIVKKESPDVSTSLRDLLGHASVEVTSGGGAQLDELKEHFPLGTEVHVAYLPNDRYEQLVATARQLRDAGFDPVPHIAARAIESRAGLDDFLARAAGDAGVRRVLAIAGDIAQPRGPFSCSLDVLKTGLLQKHGIVSIAVAGHPEGHPIVARQTMEEALRQKIEVARADGLDISIITQFCFEPAPILDYVKRLRAEGIDVPVRIGVAGPANIMTLVKFGMRCGVGNSLRSLRTKASIFGRLAADAPPDELLMEISRAVSQSEIEGLAGVHFYIFGGLRKTGQWLGAKLSAMSAQ